MKVTINSKPREIPEENPTVDELLQSLGLKDSGTAIAVNGSIIRKDARKATYINEGDDITIITAAFGG